MSLEKFWNRTVKIFIGLGIVSTLGLAGLTANYYRTHAEVKKTCIEDQCEYQHPDKETTHILNYIAGKEAMTPKERLEMVKDGFEGYCKSVDIQPPDFSAMNERELMEYLLKISPPSEYQKNETVDDVINSMNNLLPLKREYNPQLYTALWQMETEFGAPYIRWTSVRQEETTSLGNRFLNSHYNSLSNAIHIWPAEPLETLVAEFSHAKQFNENTIMSHFRYVDDVLRVAGKTISGMPPSKAYDQEYDTRGSVEYEAHRVIEPMLKEKLKRITGEK